jgi:hypothetical protein
MRHIFYGLILLVGLVMGAIAPAQAQQAPNPAIQSTINQQFDAFRADDFGKAFDFASPMIKGIFGTAENFGRMVRNGYPMVYRPDTVRMLELRDISGKLWQKVMVTDGSGATHLLDYEMIQTESGWQINAVILLPQPGLGA